jgi:aerobic carbon-monoxide dehydrogenase small subunit
MLAVQADGCVVETIEGLSDSGEIAVLQDTFVENNGVQCVFCTPGMLIAASALLASERTPTRARIRAYLSGNICRYTGYQAIVDSIESASSRMGM